MGDPPERSTAERLEFRDVTKRYPGSAEAAVDGLSLEVPAGEICVLVGPSGCGKTTAMRMVNRMIDMTSGDILLDGRSVNDRKPADLRRDIGYVIQQVGLFPHRSIADNIATVPRPARLGQGDDVGARRRAARPRRPRSGELRARYPASSQAASAARRRRPRARGRPAR